MCRVIWRCICVECGELVPLWLERVKTRQCNKVVRVPRHCGQAKLHVPAHGRVVSGEADAASVHSDVGPVSGLVLQTCRGCPERLANLPPNVGAGGTIPASRFRAADLPNSAGTVLVSPVTVTSSLLERGGRSREQTVMSLLTAARVSEAEMASPLLSPIVALCKLGVAER